MSDNNKLDFLVQSSLLRIINMLEEMDGNCNSEDISKVIDKLYGVKREKVAIETRKKMQEEREAAERKEREARELEEAHIREVTSMDKSVAFKMPKALANRLMHIEISGSFQAWKEWAIENGINEKVVGFLSFRQNYLMGFDSSSDDLAFATPRSWEMVSNLLNCISDDIDDMFSLISGIVGSGTAIEFRTWAKVYKDLPDIKDVFDGKNTKLPTGTDAMYALTAAMTAYAREHKNEIDRIANSIRYADRMPPDFSTVLMKDYMYIEKGYKETLLTIPEFSRWLQTKGRLMNGSV